MSNQEILQKLYYDPKYGLQGKLKFVQKVKKDYPKITNKEINNFFDKQSLSTMNKKMKFKGFYKIVDIPRTFQCDLFFMPAYKSTNNNISVFFIAVDILSRKMFVYPVKNRTKNEILDAIEKLKKDVPDIKGIGADDEFSAKLIVDYCNENNIKLSTDVSSEDHFNKGNKLGIVDGGVKAIKRMIRNYVLANSTTKYIDKLTDLVENYNTSVHSSLDKRTPDEAFNDIAYQQHEYDELQEHNDKLDNKIDIDIGDYVLIARDKKTFDKENTTFLPDVYVVFEQIGRKYSVLNADGEEMKRKYKYFELLKVNPDELEGKVSETEIKQVKKLHKDIVAIQKDTGKTYNEAQDEITKVNNAKTTLLSNNKGSRIPRMLRSGRQA